MVPWQNGIRIGLVVGSGETRGAGALELREVIATLEDRPFMNPAAVEALERAAAYACVPAGLLLANMLPYGFNVELEHEVRALCEGLSVPTDAFIRADAVPPQQLELYRRQGLLAERALTAVRTVQVLRALRQPDDGLAGTRRRNWRRALEVLWTREQVESAAALSREADVPESAVRGLIAEGYAGYSLDRAPLPSLPAFEGEPLPESPLRLSHETGVMSLAGGRRRDRLVALLPLLTQDIRDGRSVLVLVPEQVLVAETAGALGHHLPVAAFLGELNDRQRERLWDEILVGGPTVLVATYPGIFAPLHRLGRVVVLEEAATSYKLSSGSRIFVPTLARFLAEAHGVPLVLADAVPSPETWSGLAESSYVDLGAPEVRLHVSDLTKTDNWPLSGDLIRVLRQVEERRRQAVVLAPRRGFSAALGCADCGWLAMCPNCDLPLRYHRERYRLRCHQCGHSQSAPRACPECGGVRLEPERAAGTEWVAREVSGLLSGTPVLRYDADRRDDLSGLLAGEPGVVVGTSAIFRHPPLPNVSLVAVTLLDTVLGLSDFRAEEEAFRLLCGLAELSPHGRPLTLVQTFQPDHPVLGAFSKGDLGGFVSGLLERRKRFRYPPYSAMAKVQSSARTGAAAEGAAAWLAQAIATAGAGSGEILGPAPAPVARVRGQYSFQLFVRAADHDRLETLLAPALAYRGPARVRVEVDPRDIGAFLD